jgi:hypothetical protein
MCDKHVLTTDGDGQASRPLRDASQEGRQDYRAG